MLHLVLTPKSVFYSTAGFLRLTGVERLLQKVQKEAPSYGEASSRRCCWLEWPGGKRVSCHPFKFIQPGQLLQLGSWATGPTGLEGSLGRNVRIPSLSISNQHLVLPPCPYKAISSHFRQSDWSNSSCHAYSAVYLSCFLYMCIYSVARPVSRLLDSWATWPLARWAA